MALPQQVINQINREPDRSPGWSAGLILFCAGILVLTVVIYAGIKFGYEPYLNSQFSSTQTQIATLGQSISSSDTANLLTFYSQISNLQSLLSKHVINSQFFSWLEQNTEANVYYSQFSLVSGDQITLVGDALSEADVNEQVAVFEASPEVKSVAVTNVGVSGSGKWQFTASLTMNQSLFLVPGSAAAAATASASGTATASAPQQP